MPPYRYPYRGSRGKPYARNQFKPVPTEPCAIYTRTGRCDAGRSCRYAHNPERLALCIPFLKTGQCVKQGSERCRLSHTPKPQNTPMCTYFARGRCSNGDKCPYVHMTNLEQPQDNKPIPVCRNFAINGWCDRANLCTKRHAFDCPDFEAHGKCVNPNCTLQHVIKNGEDIVVTSHNHTHDQLINVEEFVRFLEQVIEHPKEAAHQFNCVRADNVESSEDEIAEEDEEESEQESEQEEDWDTSDLDVEEIDVNADFIKV